MKKIILLILLICLPSMLFAFKLGQINDLIVGGALLHRSDTPSGNPYFRSSLFFKYDFDLQLRVSPEFSFIGGLSAGVTSRSLLYDMEYLKKYFFYGGHFGFIFDFKNNMALALKEHFFSCTLYPAKEDKFAILETEVQFRYTFFSNNLSCLDLIAPLIFDYRKGAMGVRFGVGAGLGFNR